MVIITFSFKIEQPQLYFVVFVGLKFLEIHLFLKSMSVEFITCTAQHDMEWQK